MVSDTRWKGSQLVLGSLDSAVLKTTELNVRCWFTLQPGHVPCMQILCICGLCVLPVLVSYLLSVS